MDQEKAIAHLARIFDRSVATIGCDLFPSSRWWEAALQSAKTVEECLDVLKQIREIWGGDIATHLCPFVIRRAMEILKEDDSRIMAGV